MENFHKLYRHDQFTLEKDLDGSFFFSFKEEDDKSWYSIWVNRDEELELKFELDELKELRDFLDIVINSEEKGA